MEVLLRLFSTEEKAADGSVIPRRSCEEYLASQSYRDIIDKRLSLGGITHKDRRLRSDLDGVVGPDDQVLINNNYTHYITKLFFKDGDPALYAYIKLFDPEKFEGERRQNIQNLIGDLSSGLKLPVSVVIRAMWSPSDVAEKILDIKGVDFTLNPSFGSAGTIEVKSVRTEEKSNTKNYSNIVDINPNLEGCNIRTKVFSVEVVSTNSPREVTSLSRVDVIKEYGRNSVEAISTRNYSYITEDELKQVAKEYRNKLNNLYDKNKDLAEDDLIIQIYAVVSSIMSDRPSIEIANIIRANKPTLVQIANSVPQDEPNRTDLLKSKIDEFFRLEPKTVVYSSINSVRDRQMMVKFPRYSLINRIVKSYKLYYEQHGTEMTDEEYKLLLDLFINDIMYLLKRVQKNVINGSNFNSLYALRQFNENIAMTGDNLTKIYRRVLLSEQLMGFIPKNLFISWRDSLKIFFNELGKYVFNKDSIGDLNILQEINN